MTDEFCTAGELDDLAAEMDDPPAAVQEDTVDDDDDDADTYTGVCVGGPYDGRWMSSRYPKGFLLVDRARSVAYLYGYTSAAFTLRGERMPLDEAGRWRAADEEDYDVIAYDEQPLP